MRRSVAPCHLFAAGVEDVLGLSQCLSGCLVQLGCMGIEACGFEGAQQDGELVGADEGEERQHLVGHGRYTFRVGLFDGLF